MLAAGAAFLERVFRCPVERAPPGRSHPAVNANATSRIMAGTPNSRPYFTGFFAKRLRPKAIRPPATDVCLSATRE